MTIQELYTSFKTIKANDFAELLAFYALEKSSFNVLANIADVDLEDFMSMRTAIVTSLYSTGEFEEAIEEGGKNIDFIKEQGNKIIGDWQQLNTLNVAYSYFELSEYEITYRLISAQIEKNPKEKTLKNLLGVCVSRLNRKTANISYGIGASILVLSFFLGQERLGVFMVLLDFLGFGFCIFPLINRGLIKKRLRG